MYPNGTGPFPAVILLHSSGGFKTIKYKFKRFINSGFSIYAPDFWRKHGLTNLRRTEAFTEYREPVGTELAEIVDLMKQDPKIDKNNIFAAGYSNGGFWVCFLTGNALVNAGVSYYGVWKACWGPDCENEYPMKYFSDKSSPILALHGGEDGTQKLNYAETAWEEIRDFYKAKLESHVYEEADHGWDIKSIHSKYVYDEEVTKDAYKRTITFFKKNMK